MSAKTETIEEKKAEVLMKLRGYTQLKREESKTATGFLVKLPKENKKALVWCVPSQGTIGVQYVNQMKKAMTDAKVEVGVLVASGRYTQAAKSNARKRGIELIPRNFPAFNLFDHVLVPKHEILSSEEREKVLSQYRVHPYQLPKIRSSDPAVKAIGAKSGDILKIIRNSSTAGEYFAYRYVIEG